MPKKKIESIDPEANDEGMCPVTLPSGAIFHVHDKEFTYFTERAKRYLKDNSFPNVSDLQDMDRLLVAELLCHRWGVWLSTQRDYWGDPIDENAIARALNNLSAEIRQLKKNMGIDRDTREKQRGEDSVENYLAQLRVRAKHFGVMREQQLDRALELFNDLKAKMQLMRNTDHKEQIEQKVTPEQVLTWIWEEVIPRYDEIDAHFRENEQRYWIRKL